jgi:hypothetical protein
MAPGSDSVHCPCPRLTWTQYTDYWWAFMNIVINLWVSEHLLSYWATIILSRRILFHEGDYTQRHSLSYGAVSHFIGSLTGWIIYWLFNFSGQEAPKTQSALTTLRKKFIWVVYKYSVPTKKRIYCVFITNTNRLMLCNENIAVYCNNNINSINILCGQNAEVFQC